MPVSDTLCGLPAALSATLMAPVRTPAAVGVKVTLIVQFAPAATLLPHVFVWLKSPLIAMLLMLSVAEPELVRAIVCGLLVVPTC